MSSAPPPLPGSLPPAPLEGDRRTTGIDAVRGFAVLGLIFANIPFFASADHYLEIAAVAPLRAGFDFWSAFLVEFFVGGKCVALLAFLLGAGLALQQRRAEATGADFRRLTLRRMGALFAIGLLHMTLLWWGDVLCLYAVLGAALLPATGLGPRARRGLALGLLAGTTLLLSALATLGWILEGVTVDGDEGDPTTDWMLRMIPIIDQAYQHRGFFGIIPLRVVEALVGQAMMAFLAPFYFGLVLLGYDSVRTGWLPLDGRVPRRWQPWIFGIGATAVLSSGANAYLTAAHPSDGFTAVVYVFVGVPASILLAGLYLLGLTRLAAGPLARWLAPLANVGRTALSNYLLQSLLAGLVFSGYGLGLYGRLDSAAVLLVAAGIAAGELLWPGFWLARFRFGPAEFLWRRATYGRKSPTPAAGPS